MATHEGPNKATNNLIFAYDMTNTIKSWRGAPTTNLVDPLWTNWTIDGSGQGSIGTRTITDTYECTIVDFAANTRQYIYITSGISASTTYTFSVQYQKISGAPTLRFQIQAYNGATYLSTMSFATTAQLGITDIEGWQTAKITLTTPASTNRILWFMQDGDDYTTYTHSFVLKNVQCEQLSIASPFVVGTRTNTQAIIDMVNERGVTANSLTYNSNNSFTFDSSNNYVTPSSATITDAVLNAGSWTISAWVNMTSVNRGIDNVVCGHGSGATNNGLHLGERSARVYFGFYANDTSGTIPLSANTWYNIVYTYNFSTKLKQMYVNGVFDTSGGTVGYGGTGSNFEIGRYPWATNYKQYGSMPYFAFYNRVLTATEIQQNFNARRSFYGI